MHIDQNDKIASVPILDVRKLLRRLQDWQSFPASVVTSSLGLSQTRGQSLVRELKRRQLIERSPDFPKVDMYRVSLRGGELASASATKPIHRKTAEELLRKLCERAHAINVDPAFLNKVTEIRVFGSYLSNRRTLSDVDSRPACKKARPGRSETMENLHGKCRVIPKLSRMALLADQAGTQTLKMSLISDQRPRDA